MQVKVKIYKKTRPLKPAASGQFTYAEIPPSTPTHLVLNDLQNFPIENIKNGYSPILPHAENETTLANKLVDEVDHTGADVKVLCGQYHLKREELARLTGFSLRALAEWASHKAPSQPAQRRLREVRRFLDSLSEIVEAKAIPAWLRARNPAFDNMTPLQVIEVGEIDRLWGMIHQLGSGYLD